MGVAYADWSLLDSGAMSHADAPTEEEVCKPHGIPVPTRAIFGEKQIYDSTASGVILIPNLAKPILSEVLLCAGTAWKKVWLSAGRCVLVQMSPEAKEGEGGEEGEEGEEAEEERVGKCT